MTTRYKKGDTVRIVRKVTGARELEIGRVITLGRFDAAAVPEPLWQMTEAPFYWVCDADVEPHVSTSDAWDEGYREGQSDAASGFNGLPMNPYRRP